MNGRQLLKRPDAARVAFDASCAGLSDVRPMEPGVTGAWSVRDILAHVTTWEEEAKTRSRAGCALPARLRKPVRAPRTEPREGEAEGAGEGPGPAAAGRAALP